MLRTLWHYMTPSQYKGTHRSFPSPRSRTCGRLYRSGSSRRTRLPSAKTLLPETSWQVNRRTQRHHPSICHSITISWLMDMIYHPYNILEVNDPPLVCPSHHEVTNLEYLLPMFDTPLHAADAPAVPSALKFLNDAGAVAEAEGHHPDFHLTNYRLSALQTPLRYSVLNPCTTATAAVMPTMPMTVFPQEYLCCAHHAFDQRLVAAGLHSCRQAGCYRGAALLFPSPMMYSDLWFCV